MTMRFDDRYDPELQGHYSDEAGETCEECESTGVNCPLHRDVETDEDIDDIFDLIEAGTEWEATRPAVGPDPR